jgi:hypothetical protein
MNAGARSVSVFDTHPPLLYFQTGLDKLISEGAPTCLLLGQAFQWEKTNR